MCNILHFASTSDTQSSLRSTMCRDLDYLARKAGKQFLSVTCARRKLPPELSQQIEEMRSLLDSIESHAERFERVSPNQPIK